MNARLAAELEVTAIVRRAQQNGDFAAILRRGDVDRGTIVIVVTCRSQHVTCLERQLGSSGSYEWTAVGPPQNADSQEVADFLRKRARFDEDSWAIELDTADPERFVAETLGSP